MFDHHQSVPDPEKWWTSAWYLNVWVLQVRQGWTVLITTTESLQEGQYMRWYPTVTYHTGICGCDDVMKTPTYPSGTFLTSSHDSLTQCSTSNSSNSITFPNCSWDLYHLTKTVQESLPPIIYFVTLLLNYLHNLLSWSLIIIPLPELLQQIFSLLCFQPFSESWLCLHLVG